MKDGKTGLLDDESAEVVAARKLLKSQGYWIVPWRRWGCFAYKCLGVGLSWIKSKTHQCALSSQHLRCKVREKTSALRDRHKLLQNVDGETSQNLLNGTEKTSSQNGTTGEYSKTEPMSSSPKNNSQVGGSQISYKELLGYLCLFVGVLFDVVAVVDFAGMFFHYDFTGVSWSPIVFGLIGQLFMKAASFFEDKQNAGESEAETLPVDSVACTPSVAQHVEQETAAISEAALEGEGNREKSEENKNSHVAGNDGKIVSNAAEDQRRQLISLKERGLLTEEEFCKLMSLKNTQE